MFCLFIKSDFAYFRLLDGIYTVSQKTSHFIICCHFNMPESKRAKFGTYKEETQSYKTHIAILKLFHF